MTDTQRNSLRCYIEELLSRSSKPADDQIKSGDAEPLVNSCDPSVDATYPEMAANLIGWCLRAVHSWTEDVLLLARYLRLLYKLDRTEVFHCQVKIQ